MDCVWLVAKIEMDTWYQFLSFYRPSFPSSQRTGKLGRCLNFFLVLDKIGKNFKQLVLSLKIHPISPHWRMYEKGIEMEI